MTHSSQRRPPPPFGSLAWAADRITRTLDREEREAAALRRPTELSQRQRSYSTCRNMAGTAAIPQEARVADSQKGFGHWND